MLLPSVIQRLEGAIATAITRMELQDGPAPADPVGRLIHHLQIARADAEPVFKAELPEGSDGESLRDAVSLLLEQADEASEEGNSGPFLADLLDSAQARGYAPPMMQRDGATRELDRELDELVVVYRTQGKAGSRGGLVEQLITDPGPWGAVGIALAAAASGLLLEFQVHPAADYLPAVFRLASTPIPPASHTQ